MIKNAAPTRAAFFAFFINQVILLRFYKDQVLGSFSAANFLRGELCCHTYSESGKMKSDIQIILAGSST
ncbi:hypothetical protein BIV60_04915 [Bacillus sp. MUM 116]|nr:hypothetical protein BIV60_04915 [Bacillus sp. MUM 116]